MDQESSSPREIAPGAGFAPVPDWVELQPYPIPKTPNPYFIAGGLCVLLDESQIDLCGPERAWFYRRADLVTAPVGAERAAQFTVTYDPKYERLDIHAVRVWRDGQLIDHTRAPGFEAFRREQNMERLIFDGRQTIAYTMPDVRPGDVVEVAHTRYGMRKSMGGRHSAWTPFEWGGGAGVIDMRMRLRAPKNRAIQERNYNNPPEATERVDGDIIDRRWRAIERPAVKHEALTPPWTLQTASVQWTEWRDWAEVVEALTPLYEEPAELPPEAEAEVQRIAAADATPAERAAAVLRFTQNAIRYLAIAIGEGGYTPRGLGDICTTRYGDCKDKSKLYTAMARKLGLDACPALVNTHDGYVFDACLPSGQLFDHCIVRLAIGDDIYWLDPTRLLQPSPLSTLSQCHYGWALPLKAGVTGLERMPEPKVEAITETVETVNLGDSPDTPVRYEWEQKFRGVRAEGLRERFARDGAVGVFKSYTEDIQRTWPKARVVAQDLVSDDIDTNTVTVREVYEIDDAWTLGDDGKHKFATRDITLRGVLAPLDPGERKHPIYLGQPGRISRRVDLRTTVPHDGGWSHSHEASALSFRDEMKVVSTQYLTLEQSLEIRELSLPATEAETYRKVCDKLGSNELLLSETAVDGKFVGRRPPAGAAPSFWDIARYLIIGLFVVAAIVRCAAIQ